MPKLLKVHLGEVFREGDLNLKKRIAFATCVQLGMSCIEQIYKLDGKLDLIITLKDEKAKNKSGRVYLDDFATKNKCPLLKIDNINDQIVRDSLISYKIDWLFIIGWSQIANKELLETPRNGCLGMHPTLLPEGRGRAAIPWAILKGLKETGVTLFRLDEGVDTGDIVGFEKIEINDQTTATDLYNEINRLHVALIDKYWSDIIDEKIDFTKQDESLASEWPGRRPEDGEIFNTMTMSEAERLVRAVTHPYPGAFYQGEEHSIRIWSAEVNKHFGTIKLTDGYLTPIKYDI